jgi:hypothetical protein
MTLESFCGRIKLWSGTKDGISLRMPRPVSGCRIVESQVAQLLRTLSFRQTYLEISLHYGGVLFVSGVAFLEETGLTLEVWHC